MKYVRYLIFLWIIFFILPVSAHDIGITFAELHEYKNNNYTLSVQTGSLNPALFPAPFLPSHCHYIDIPQGIKNAGWLRFEFQCKKSIISQDNLAVDWPREGLMINAIWSNGQQAQKLFLYENGKILISMEQLLATSGSWFNAAQRYLKLGVEHILTGTDHLLFVLGLLLISTTYLQLFKVITAFTVGHSITLGLATLGYVHAPSRPIEAAIALSILFLAVEIIHMRQGKPSLISRYPWGIAFAFGLLHGLGFASALSQVGLPEKEIPFALLFFNIGIEFGQLLFIMVILLFMQLFKRIHYLSKTFSLLPIYVIGVTGSYWFIERTFIYYHLFI